MTPQQVIDTALTRNLDPLHIKQADIDLAISMYADGYTSLDDYYNEVVAYGVIVNIWERISTEITDRGVVQMISQGASIPDFEARQRVKQEYRETLERYQALMEGVEYEGVIMTSAEVNTMAV